MNTRAAAVIAAAGIAACPGWPVARHSEWNWPAAALEMLALSITRRLELLPSASISLSRVVMVMAAYPMTTTVKALDAGAAAKASVTRFTDGRVTSHSTVS